jgi:hypothetical protein
MRRHPKISQKIDNLAATHLTFMSRKMRRHPQISQKIDNLAATHLTFISY